MTRYWTSWWSQEGPITTSSLRVWVTGWRMSDDAESYVAEIEAPSEAAVWAKVDRDYPNNERRFIRPMRPDEQRGDRFP